MNPLKRKKKSTISDHAKNIIEQKVQVYIKIIQSKTLMRFRINIKKNR